MSELHRLQIRRLRSRKAPALAALAALAATLLAAPALSQPPPQPATGAEADDPRPRVRVEVKVAEPGVHDRYGDGTEDLEFLVAEDLAAFFDQEIRFLHFVPADAASDASDAHLRLTLGRADASDLPHPLDLTASLSGAAVADAAPRFRIPVRGAAGWGEPMGNVETFAAEIVGAARAVDHQTWVRELFGMVVLGEKAHVFQDPSGWYWALPFRLDEMGAEPSTEFLVDSELTIHGNLQERLTRAEARGHVGPGNDAVPPTFHTKAMARILEREDEDLLSQASDCRSRRILVSHYVRSFRQVVDESSGSSLDLSGGER